jgi:AcrR family transcriptional regulator
MPRIAGQIDRAKTEAILASAMEVLSERGLSASLDEVARRAGVSKQTIYNHYGCKADLVRAMIERRVKLISAPLETPDALARPEEALAAYARGLLEAVGEARNAAVFRLIIEIAPATPELAQAIFDAGMGAPRAKLADFLRRENGAGRLATPDPAEAAGFFAGMVVGHHQLKGLLGLPLELTAERIEHIATEASRRFMRAYGP